MAMSVDMQPGIEDLIRELSSELGQVYRWIAEEVGLNHTDLMALYYINRREGSATPKSLAEHLGLTTGATAILINRLEKRGYVVRTPHPTDRRGVLLSMGQAAQEHEFAELGKRLKQLNAEVIADLSPEESAIIRAFLTSIVTNTRETLQHLRTAPGSGSAPSK
jgi:DNA-binding MarR family transcriptional regulator